MRYLVEVENMGRVQESYRNGTCEFDAARQAALSVDSNARVYGLDVSTGTDLRGEYMHWPAYVSGRIVAGIRVREA